MIETRGWDTAAEAARAAWRAYRAADDVRRSDRLNPILNAAAEAAFDAWLDAVRERDRAFDAMIASPHVRDLIRGAGVEDELVDKYLDTRAAMRGDEPSVMVPLRTATPGKPHCLEVKGGPL